MRHVTFTFKGATLSVSEDTNGVGVDAEYVLYMIFPSPNGRQARLGIDYGSFLARVTLVDGDPGFVLPSLDDPQAVRDFYRVYQDLPREFRTAYVNAQAELMIAANAEDLTPGIDPNVTAPPTEGGATVNSNGSTEPSTPSLEIVAD